MRNRIIICRLSLIKIYFLVLHVLCKFRDSVPLILIITPLVNSNYRVVNWWNCVIVMHCEETEYHNERLNDADAGHQVL